MRVRAKICGITNWADAKLAVDAGAAALGFNFYPKSPRYIEPEAARRIVGRLPRGVQAVGVFVNSKPFAVAALAGEVGLHSAQLHGDEPPGWAQTTAAFLPVWKAFRVNGRFRPAQLAAFRASADTFLLDGFSRRAHGGTGRTFDWGLARRAGRFGRIVLAGGLNAENVAQAIREARPWAIDVCSSVEARPGKKEPRKLREFMSALATCEVTNTIGPGRLTT